MTETLTRRGLLACLPAATVATIVPAAAEPLADPAAVLRRAEHVVSVLRSYANYDSRAAADGPTWDPAWFDNASADRMLAFLRAEAAGAAPTDESLQAMVDFCVAHHQSLGYIMDGNINSLILRSASCAPAAFDDFTA